MKDRVFFSHGKLDGKFQTVVFINDPTHYEIALIMDGLETNKEKWGKHPFLSFLP